VRLAVLAVTSSPVPGQIISGAGWEVIESKDCVAAREILSKRNVPVVLYDRDASEDDWRECLKSLATTQSHPCVILMSPVNDSYLWQEVILSGGYDVLARPFHEEQVVSMIRRAWIFWKAR
jgi:DNA-binding NtrC family response regulator